MLVPWILFLFMAVFNFGFYAYALIATTNAARAAVLATSVSPATAGRASAAWPLVIGEMRRFPNVDAGAGCCSDGDTLSLTAQRTDEPDGTITSTVTIRYRTVQLIPLPFMAGQMTITRTAQASVVPL